SLSPLISRLNDSSVLRWTIKWDISSASWSCAHLVSSYTYLDDNVLSTSNPILSMEAIPKDVGWVGSSFFGCKARCLNVPLVFLEPISKSFEEDNEAGKLDKAEEIVGMVLPANEDPALPFNPSEEALDEPASHVAA